MQYKAKVLSIEKYNDNGRTEFEVVRIEKPFNFNPGQYVILGVDGFEKTGYYSIASSPDQKYLEFCAKIKETPGFSSYLGEHLEIGSIMNVSEPQGNFSLNPEARENIFIAVGSAIAPFMSMIRSLPDRKMTLFYGYRNKNQFLYGRELENIHNLDLYAIASQEKGHVQDLLRDYEFSREEDVYVCGSKEMIADVKSILESKGFDQRQIHV